MDLSIGLLILNFNNRFFYGVYKQAVGRTAFVVFGVENFYAEDVSVGAGKLLLSRIDGRHPVNVHSP